MKHSSFLIFLSIVLAIHTLVNYYIFIRGCQALPSIKLLKISYIIVFVFLFLSYIIARLLERSDYYYLAKTLNWIGSFWLAGMLYFFFLVLFFDILRVANYFMHFFPSFMTKDWALTKQLAAILSVVSVAVIFLLGYINSLNPKILMLVIH